MGGGDKVGPMGRLDVTYACHMPVREARSMHRGRMIGDIMVEEMVTRNAGAWFERLRTLVFGDLGSGFYDDLVRLSLALIEEDVG